MIYKKKKKENIEGKEENAGYQHFLLIPQFLQKSSFSGSLKPGVIKAFDIKNPLSFKKLYFQTWKWGVQFQCSVLKIFKVSIPEHRIFNRVFSDFSVVLRETTLAVSDSTVTSLLDESEIVRVVSLYTMEVSEVTRLEKNKKITDLLGKDTLK